MGFQTEGSLELLQKTRRCSFLSKPCFWTWSYKACLAFNIRITLLPIHSLQQTGVCPEGINRLFEIWKTTEHFKQTCLWICWHKNCGAKTRGQPAEIFLLNMSLRNTRWMFSLCVTCLLHVLPCSGASLTRLVVKSLEHAPMAQRPRLVM